MEIPVKIMKKPNEKKPNELNARDAFITILRSLTDIEYVKSESPDEVNRRTPDVDFLLFSSSSENGKIAVEHTRVESFNEEIKYVKRWRDIVCSVNAGCRQRIPPDRYYFLAAPPIIVDSLVGKRREQFVCDLSSRVAETAPKLLQVDSYIQSEYEGHKITLICSGDHAHLNGNVWCMPQEPEDQKALQSERLRRAVETKVPKLTKYKEQRFKTALLLEDVAGTLRGSTLRGYESLQEVDYVVVFVSIEDKMIIGNVWKERSVWYSFVPGNRRFLFPREPQAGGPQIEQ
ncbi:MAG TPA: hypothetical protein VFB10_13230 [Candidatus Dormibacteraeota bacterium]|nr:hypothetical protein [Candidatus Dormibacteraeota bacterium]